MVNNDSYIQSEIQPILFPQENCAPTGEEWPEEYEEAETSLADKMERKQPGSKTSSRDIFSRTPKWRNYLYLPTKTEPVFRAEVITLQQHHYVNHHLEGHDFHELAIKPFPSSRSVRKSYQQLSVTPCWLATLIF